MIKHQFQLLFASDGRENCILKYDNAVVVMVPEKPLTVGMFTHSADCISQSGRCADNCVSGQSCQSRTRKRVGCCGLHASPGNKDDIEKLM